MKNLWMMVAVLAIAAVPTSLYAQPKESGEGAALTPAAILNQASGAMAIFSCTIDDEFDTPVVSGQAICIDPSGVFMTLALGGRTKTSTMKDFTLTLPGVKGKSFKAELLGIDGATGIAFIRATEPNNWSVVRFTRKASVSPGQQVVAVGMLSGDLGGVPYLGIAYVSALIRVPGEMVYVTGGNLTNPGSPVFAADGRAVGIVGQQLFLNYQMATNRGPTGVRMSGQQETSFFLPVEEFVSVLESPPTGGKATRLPWIGATSFEPVDKGITDILKLDKPGVVIDRVVPAQPGAEAGLKDRDVVVAVNGSPLELLPTPDLVRQNFVRQLMRMKPNDTVKLTVVRATGNQDLTVKLGVMPTQPFEADRYVCRTLGFVVRDKVMLDEYITKNPAFKNDGVVVFLMADRSPAKDGGLQPDDVITNVNDQPVKTVATFKQVIEGALNAKPNQAVNLLVRRGDQAQAVSIQPPPPQRPAGAGGAGGN